MKTKKWKPVIYAQLIMAIYPFIYEVIPYPSGYSQPADLKTASSAGWDGGLNKCEIEITVRGGNKHYTFSRDGSILCSAREVTSLSTGQCHTIVKGNSGGTALPETTPKHPDR